MLTCIHAIHAGYAFVSVQSEQVALVILEGFIYSLLSMTSGRSSLHLINCLPLSIRPRRCILTPRTMTGEGRRGGGMVHEATPKRLLGDPRLFWRSPIRRLTPSTIQGNSDHTLRYRQPCPHVLPRHPYPNPPKQHSWLSPRLGPDGFQVSEATGCRSLRRVEPYEKCVVQ